MEKDKLSENLITLIPIMHKKLCKTLPSFGISRQQMELLYLIKLEDGKPMKYYCDKLMVSKPNLTVIADKLIGEGLIKRENDLEDRRVIILKLTRDGEIYLKGKQEIIKQDIMNRLSQLDVEDIEKLNRLLCEIQEILNKLE